MPTLTAPAWKRFYRRERAALGEPGLADFLDQAPRMDIPNRGAIIFPHTRLTASGRLIAAAALAALRTGADRILAIGVLHGPRPEEPAAVKRLRRIHGPGLPGDLGRWKQEFSLDAFTALVELAARRQGRKPPEIIARYPFLVGNDPDSMPGIERLAALTRGCALVATTDPIHHGAGYDTPKARCRARQNPASLGWARRAVNRQLRCLEEGGYSGFQRAVLGCRSDFRDTGPVLAALLRRRGRPSFKIRGLRLVDYCDVLASPPPTWVAAALISARV